MTTLTSALREACAAHAERPALVEGGRTWTYAALADRARALARGLGGEPGVIGVLVRSRLDVLTGLLGAAFAGQAWLLLDPSFPAARLGAVVARIGPVRLVVDEPGAALAALVAPGIPALRIDREPEPTAPRPPPGPDAPAAVMVTSGSTGEPRGVIHTQAGLAWHARNLIARLGLGPADRLSAIPSPMFAASTSDHLPALLSGASLHPFDPRVQPLGDLTTLVREGGLTTMLLGPTVFRRWTATPGFDLRGAASLRWVRVGGEASGRDDRARFLATFPPTARMAVTLGASEVHGIALGEVDPDGPAGPVLSVGPPLPGVTVAVHAEHGEAGPGEAGELWVSSPGLAAGYVGDDAETDARFVRREGRRWWRSGDVVHRDAAGRLHVVGRGDDRLKVRGEPVVVAVVEALLREFGVREAAVGMAPGVRGEPALTAWVVRGSRPFTVEAARSALGADLPRAAVPTAWVVLPVLPRTPAGKLHRAALPPPSDGRPPLAGPRVLPRDPTERAALLATEEELGLRGTGVTDDFFALGGDSVRLVGLLGRIAARFGRAPDPAAYLADPTPRGLGRWLCAAREEAQVHWVAVGEGPAVVWCHGDYNGAGLYLRGVAEAAPGLPILSVAPHGLVPRRLPATVREMAAELAPAVLAALPAGRPFLVGGHCNGAAVAVELAHALAAAGRAPGSVVLLAPPPWPARVAPPPAPRAVATPAEAFEAWRAVLHAHAPTSWPGELLLWIPRHLEWDASPWRAAGLRARVVVVPGNHHGSVTEHRASLAKGLARAAAGVAP